MQTSPGHTRDTQVSLPSIRGPPAAGNRVSAPTDHQRAGPEPDAGRLVTPGTLVGFRHARASPSTHRFQRPPGTSLTYTELSPAQPSGSMLQSGMDAHPGAYAPGRCTVSRSPGSAPLALRGGVRHSSMVGGDGTATGEKRSTSGAFRPKTLIRTNAVIAHRACPRL